MRCPYQETCSMKRTHSLKECQWCHEYWCISHRTLFNDQPICFGCRMKEEKKLGNDWYSIISTIFSEEMLKDSGI